MATQIAITPRLDKRSSREFAKKVSDELDRHVGPKPTPQIDEIIKKFFSDVNRRQK